MGSNRTRLVCLVAFALATAGCTSLWQATTGSERRGVSSSLVDYLYPEGEEPPAVSDRIPRLELPLRVGLAFVPSTYRTDMPFLSEATKTDLLDRVREQFLDRDYIADIEVIPETYLRAGRGFTSLEQVSRLYDLDVIALVSYDQVVTADDTKSSILYWTIIGAYVIEGSKNDVQTFVDTAVFDVPTRQLLFRAPGIDKASARSTLVESSEGLRETRTASFARAMEEMTANLVVELDGFEARLENEPALVEVVPAGGASGGGAAGMAFLVLLTTACLRRRAGRPTLSEPA